eukprot:354633-Chlamydomonas_euryale.AAC.16
MKLSTPTMRAGGRLCFARRRAGARLCRPVRRRGAGHGRLACGCRPRRPAAKPGATPAERGRLVVVLEQLFEELVHGDELSRHARAAPCCVAAAGTAAAAWAEARALMCRSCAVTVVGKGDCESAGSSRSVYWPLPEGWHG